MYEINFWSVLVAAIVSFGIGALWYSPILFGKEWMSLMKISDSNMNDPKDMWKSYLLHFIGTIISFCILAFIISMSRAVSASDGAFLGFIAWLGFAVPISISNLLWRRDPMKLVLIDTIHVLVGLVIGGAIIGAWQ